MKVFENDHFIIEKVDKINPLIQRFRVYNKESVHLGNVIFRAVQNSWAYDVTGIDDKSLRLSFISLLTSIKNEYTMEKEKQFEIPQIGEIYHKELIKFKEDQSMYVTFSLKENPDTRYQIELFRTNNHWNYYEIEMFNKEKKEWTPLRNTPTLTYCDFLFDALVDQVKALPSMRTKMFFIEDKRYYKCSFFNEIKAYKNRNEG